MRAFRLALLVSVFVMAIGLAGCGGEDSAPASRSDASPGPDMETEKPDLEEMAKNLSPEAQKMMETAVNYLDHKKTQIKSFDESMVSLAAKAEQKGAETKAEYDKTKAEWDVKVKETLALIDQLIVDAYTDPTPVKQKGQKAFLALKETADAAKEKFN